MTALSPGSAEEVKMAPSPDDEAAANPPVRSLYKGLRALDLLRTGQEIRTTDLAEALDVDKGVASRILQTLVLAGYAERVVGRRYVLGPKLGTPGSVPPVHRGSIKPRAQPLMAALAAQTRESVYLGVLADDQVLYIDSVVPQNELIVNRPIPTLSPRCCTALGKLFSATMQLPLPPLRAYTEKSITNPQAYRAELRRIAEFGYAWDDEEYNLGVRCVAAALHDEDGNVVGGLSVAAPTARLAAAQLEDVAKATKTIADTFRSS